MLLNHYSLSLYLRLRMLLLLGASTLIISSCSPGDLLLSGAKAALGGGGGVNGQIGQTNQQGVNVTTEAPSVTVRPKGRVDTIDQSTRNFVENETWLIIAFALALLLDSPARWPGQIWRAIRRK